MTFEARLRIPGRTRIPLGVEVDIVNERLMVATGDRKLADWALDDLQVVSLPDGFHVKANGEEVILSVADPARFAGRLGIPQDQPSRPVSSASARRKYSQERSVPSIDDLERCIASTAEALTSNSMSPPAAFAMWLRLLKVLNSLHGKGSIPREVFHRLNAEALELIPEPDPEEIRSGRPRSERSNRRRPDPLSRE